MIVESVQKMATGVYTFQIASSRQHLAYTLGDLR